MSKPSKENNHAADCRQTKTMFYTEGNPTALLVTTIAGRRRKEIMDFPTPHAALTWCQAHGSNLFYTATNIQHG